MSDLSDHRVRYVPVCWCDSRRGGLFCGGVLLLTGLVLLLTQFGLLPNVVYDLIGPFLLLALGACVLLGAVDRDNTDRRPTGPTDPTWRQV